MQGAAGDRDGTVVCSDAARPGSMERVRAEQAATLQVAVPPLAAARGRSPSADGAYRMPKRPPERLGLDSPGPLAPRAVTRAAQLLEETSRPARWALLPR
jgi:hypothetical protein